MYELLNATKRYKQKNREITALNSVTLSIKTGDMVAIQGPTGGGKSTLLQLLGGLDRPTSGGVEIDGRDLESREPKAPWSRLVWAIAQITCRPSFLAASNSVWPLLVLW
jgi:putative ABC transport system ATP-binding protein